jgi:hypothetical protein
VTEFILESSRPSGFVEGLSFKDHMLLRRVAKAVHIKMCGVRGRELTDEQADRQIESWGPGVMEKRLRLAIENKRTWEEARIR